MSYLRLCGLLLAVLMLSPFATPLVAQQAKLETIDAFGANPGYSSGQDVTDGGVVVGIANEWGQPGRPFRWTSSIGIQPIAPELEGGAASVSADGAAVVGVTNGVDSHAFLWTSSQGAQEVFVKPANVARLMEAKGISADGSTFVGKSQWSSGLLRAYRYGPDGYQDLNVGSSFIGSSGATAISGDAGTVVGWTDVWYLEGFQAFHVAFLWSDEEGMQSLGSLSPNPQATFEQSHAYGVSNDGSFVVGDAVTNNAKRRAWIYTEETGMQALPTIENVVGDAWAYGVSDDGRMVVGRGPSPARPAGEGCVWIEGTAYSLRELLDQYGVDTTAWTTLGTAYACSPDGSRITGSGVREGKDRAFCITLRPDFQPPTLATEVEEGESFVVKLGETFEATFLGTDPDGEGLTLTATGLPGGAELTPASGSTSTSPVEAELSLTPGLADVGTHEITISFSDGYANGTVSRSFTIVVPANQAPTVDPIAPVTRECVDGKHTVTLSTTVDDADDHPLTVTWKVAGQIEQTENLEAGEDSAFEFAYDHGVHDVTIEVSDGFDTTTAGTTVTVQDTKAPVVVVAEDVTVATDAGEAFASNVILPRPTASDASGHAVTLAGDARETYPLGLTLVTWTATDESGNSATATQKVNVEDRERPTIEGVESLQVSVDRGQVFSTAKPPLPEASDNATETSKIRITSDAPPRFPIGKTKVTFRATDAAGNFAEWTTDVVVVNAPPKANAGRNVTVWTKSERGAKVRLNGSRSSDCDAQALAFAWTANKVKLQAAWSARPIARFPVGGAAVKLTVTDPAGLKSVDTVRVLVKLRNGRRRPRGADANRSFAAAAQQAASSVRTSRSGSATLSGLAYANAAAAYGDAAGEFVQWEDGQSEADALPAYAELRSLQATYGQAAAKALLSAYAETGDESLLSAYGYAAYGTAYAAADLNER